MPTSRTLVRMVGVMILLALWMRLVDQWLRS